MEDENASSLSSSDRSSSISSISHPETRSRFKQQLNSVADSIQQRLNNSPPTAAETEFNENDFGEEMMDGHELNLKRPTRQFGIKKKFREFYTAPITKFWLWSITYFLFLVDFTYTMLIATPPVPQWNEFYVIAFMATLGFEKIREIFASEPVKLRRKLSVWSSSIWNCCDAFFVCFFFVALILRLDGNTLDIGRVFYCLNIIYW